MTPTDEVLPAHVLQPLKCDLTFHDRWAVEGGGECRRRGPEPALRCLVLCRRRKSPGGSRGGMLERRRWKLRRLASGRDDGAETPGGGLIVQSKYSTVQYWGALDQVTKSQGRGPSPLRWMDKGRGLVPARIFQVCSVDRRMDSGWWRRGVEECRPGVG